MLMMLRNRQGEATCRRSAGPELLRDWIARAARRAPDKPWVVSAEDGRSVSYGAAARHRRPLRRIAARRGLGRNDRVALLANNSIEHLLCYFGVMAAGATVCTVHIEMNRNQLGNIFERLKPRLILIRMASARRSSCRDRRAALAHRALGPAGSRHAVRRACAAGAERSRRARRGPEDDAIILFTSGTSATPKGVILNFREYLLNIDPLAEGFGITADDRLYDFRPFSWNSAQTLGALAVVNRGATLVLAEKFSASRFFRTCAITASRSPPAIRRRSIFCSTASRPLHRDNLPKLRFITSSSAPLLLEEWKRFEQKFGIPVAQGCGASEVSWIAAIPGEQRRLGKVGRPFAYHDLAIVDAEGRRCPRAKSAMWSSAAWAIIRTAISARTAT